MAEMSQSTFLQAIGWAMLNSIWQMGLLWCFYYFFSSFAKLSSSQRYMLSVSSLFFGFAWSLVSFFSYAADTTLFTFSVSEAYPYSFLNSILVAASVTYFLLLIFPAGKLVRNWRFVRRIKTTGIQKAAIQYRIFVEQISVHLNIKTRVSVFVSEIVTSPVTIGYFKPVILLPVAALNGLTTTQVEAILLHELSHIRRMDYLLNIFVNIISTLMYYNPFVKCFMHQVDIERENCCDELVIQFGYDKHAYCAALLSLEKSARHHHQIFAVSATGKNHLLTRIEKIVGMKKKKPYRIGNLIPAFAAIVCLFVLNSVLILKDAEKSSSLTLASSTIVNPFYFIENGKKAVPEVHQDADPFFKSPSVAAAEPQKRMSTPAPQRKEISIEGLSEVDISFQTRDYQNQLIPVSADEVEKTLTTEQKEQVKTTVNATKKVLTTVQWQQVENSMADALDAEEKNLVKEEYLKQLEAVNWSNFEKNLKANYEKVDWFNLNSSLITVLTEIERKDLEKKLKAILEQLESAEKEITHSATSACVAPDVSLAEITVMKNEVKKNLKQISEMEIKKTIRL